MALYTEVTGEPERLAWMLERIWISLLALGPQPPVVSTANGMKSHPAWEQRVEYFEDFKVSARVASDEGETSTAEAERDVRRG